MFDRFRTGSAAGGKLLNSWGNRLQIPEILSHLGPAFLVGLGGGLGAIVFRWLIGFFTRISFTWLPEVTRGMDLSISSWHRPWAASWLAC